MTGILFQINMNTSQSPKLPDDLKTFSSKFGARSNRTPAQIFLLDDNVPAHVTRLILLINFAGRPVVSPAIIGRTKLANLDFFVRYPLFLEKAVNILGSEAFIAEFQELVFSSQSIDSHMIRYKYGPWDNRYYNILAYMVGKQLLVIKPKSNADVYSLTNQGIKLLEQLVTRHEFSNTIKRCQIVGQLFETKSGTEIKDFIYRHFPEVVHTPHNQLIQSDQDVTDSG